MEATSKWRTPEDGRALSGHLIGPNAILQLIPVIEALGGPERVEAMMARAGVFGLPDGTRMIPEGDAARLHRQLRLEEPDMAPRLAAEAGRRTADYILANRIPGPVRLVLKILPPGPSARALSHAIARHAWTFAGSGEFRVVTPWTFEIRDNPIIRGEISERCLCDWHAGVFARLYAVLVDPSATCREVDCGAKGRGHLCRFEVGVG